MLVATCESTLRVWSVQCLWKRTGEMVNSFQWNQSAFKKPLELRGLAFGDKTNGMSLIDPVSSSSASFLKSRGLTGGYHSCFGDSRLSALTRDLLPPVLHPELPLDVLSFVPSCLPTDGCEKKAKKTPTSRLASDSLKLQCRLLVLLLSSYGGINLADPLLITSYELFSRGRSE